MTKKRKKRIMGWLMAFMMLISVFPTNIPHIRALDSYAAEGGAASPSEADQAENETIGEGETEAEEETAAETEAGNETADETKEDVASPSSGKTSGGGGKLPVNENLVVNNLATLSQIGLLAVHPATVLPNLEAELYQGDNQINLSEEPLVLDTDKEIKVKYSFDIPTDGTIEYGDIVEFQLVKGFSVIAGKTEVLKKTVDGHEYKIGTLKIIQSEDNVVKAELTFDQDDDIFDETHEISGNFSASFSYVGSGEESEDKNPIIYILDKDYEIKVVEKNLEYTIVKSAKVDEDAGIVQWKAVITAKKGENHQSLAGVQFKDDLAEIGAFVPGSFQVQDANHENKTVKPDPIDESKISYSFDDESLSPATVTFKTVIPDDAYNGKIGSVTNKAEIDKDNELVTESNEATASFDFEWITKTGTPSQAQEGEGNYNPKDRTIDWEIIVDNHGKELSNVIITDDLDKRLTPINPAKYYESLGSEGGKDTWSETGTDINGVGMDGKWKYTIDSVNSKIKLVIKTKLEDEDFTYKDADYKNKASVTWNGKGEFGTSVAEATVGIGYEAFAKSGKSDIKEQKVHWDITVTPRNQNAVYKNLKVYDLFAYGEKIDTANVYVDTVDPAVQSLFSTNVSLKNIEAKPYQQYVKGSFPANDFIAEPKVYEIKNENDDTAVGDLVVFTVPTDIRKATLSFDTKILDPKVYSLSEKWVTGQIPNTASLFGITEEGEEKFLTKTNANAHYDNRILSKKLLRRDAIEKNADGTEIQTIKAADANKATDTEAEGFDYKSRSAIFRLSINADEVNYGSLTDEKGLPWLTDKGIATITDTLPEGWEIVNFSNGFPFIIFRGDGTLQYPHNDAAKASGESLAQSEWEALFEYKYDSDKRQIILTSKASLKDSYVVLINAKPTDETFKDYIHSNHSNPDIVNELTMKINEWGETTDSQKVDVTSKLLTKEWVNNGGKLPEDGVMEWKIKYQPNELSFSGITLKDTIPDGIDLPVDKNGKIIVDVDYIYARELTLQSDGTYNKDNSGQNLNLVWTDDIASETDKDKLFVSYNKGSRELKFKIPDGDSKAYLFAYKTDITGEIGDKISNSVILEGFNDNVTKDSAEYEVNKFDAAITIKRIGLVRIHKIGDSKDLPGVEFTLYESDGTTVVDKKVTDAKGIAKFKPLAINGIYVLKETAAPDDYVLSKHPYDIEVKIEDGNVKTYIDGEAYENNTLEVVNHKPGDIVKGDLSIKKLVTAPERDPGKKFKFIVTLKGTEIPEDYAYTYLLNGTKVKELLRKNSVIELGDGDYVEILDLPIETQYTVTEVDYAASGYVPDQVDGIVTGSIVNAENTVVFVNTSPGNLRIEKFVDGDDSSTTDVFDFKVTFEGAEGPFVYTGENGAPKEGSLENGGIISLSSGQNITIPKLPVGTKYKVEEVDSKGYTAKEKEIEGIISADDPDGIAIASFTNTKNKPAPDKTGKLTISKKVSGSGASTTKAFDFTVKLSADGSYSYKGNGVVDGMIKDGDTISLAHGQSITIQGLPDGSTYAVTESNYSNYTMKAVDDQGIISADLVNGNTAAFTNTRYRSSGGGGGSSSGGGPKVVHTTPGSEVSNVTVENPADDGSGLLGAEIEKQDPTGLLGASVNRTPKTGDDGLRNIWLLGLAISISLLLVSTGLRITVGSRDRRRRK